jgi:MoaA/NifB/PqqE/SkfB family radical SAM enzyme
MQSIITGNFLPPYWVSTDPSNACNQNCCYCNTSEHRRRTGAAIMPGEHLLKLANFYKDWGIKATIIEGGGEPLMGESVPQFIERLHKYDIESGLITNGSLMGEEYAEILPRCSRWVGVSVDAATPETYRAIRGVNLFDIVIKNISRLCKNRGNLDVRMKLLMHPQNISEIVPFVKLALDCGCSGAHIKPLTLENVEGKHTELQDIDISYVNEQLVIARQYQSSTFDVDCINYKHNERYQRIVRFEHCQCTPMGGVFGADGKFWLCYNMRGREGFYLCDHYPDPVEVKRIWGTEYHKLLVDKINPKNCMRCGLTQYNEIMEKCVQHDNLFRNFP